MPWKGNFITKRDLGIAYRKAKVDLYYERDHPNAFALCEYEENLHYNLTSLFKKLTSGELGWMSKPEFVGGWSAIPKGIAVSTPGEDASWQPSEPDEAWSAFVEAWRSRGNSRRIDKRKKKPSANFRLVGVHSIDFHVVSALWMLKVGYLYDGILGSEAYANRLRRVGQRRKAGTQGRVNPYSLGSFQPYFGPFARWRDNGLSAMRDALNQNKVVVAITADVRQFYHKTSPDFLLDERYLNVVGLEQKIAKNEREFTQAIIEALHAWAVRSPVRGGLPVGLPAARLIANVALAELDRVICKEVVPIYYGRYVDDILLVLENTQGFKNDFEVWEYIRRRTGKLLKIKRQDGTAEIKFDPSYLRQSEIILAGSKQKVFLLRGETGKTLVKSIEHQILVRASQWQALPDRPDDAGALAADIVTAIGEDGEQVDNLRKTESLSLRRAALAIRLRDMEAFEQDLPVNGWRIQRRAFLETMKDHLLALPQFFDFAIYFSRIFALAIACREYKRASDLLVRLNELVDRVQRDCEVSLAASKLGSSDGKRIILSWRQHLVRSLSESLAAALGPNQREGGTGIDTVLGKLGQLSSSGEIPLQRADDAFKWASRLFMCDMGRAAFRERYFDSRFPHFETGVWTLPDVEITRQSSLSQNSPFEEERLFDCVKSFLKQTDPNEPKIPIALLYPTRPFHIDELYILVPSLLGETNGKNIKDWAFAFRGFSPANQLPRADGPAIVIPHAKALSKRRIAVTSWETSVGSWRASVTAQPDPDTTRYQRLNSLMNAILSAKKRPDYVVLPELSIPWRWFLRTASKLMNRRISLIAGIEYLPHQNGKKVANQVWASLISEFLGFPSIVVYRQDKRRPALGEELELQQIAGVQLEALGTVKKPVLRHGNFHFGILVCSELTNAKYRHKFRGKVDAVFIPEWNQDTETFSSLVETSALDIHAFMVQCNNRIYGDSRIRAPSRDSWQRDIVRVKGGVEDYFVTGEIDVQGLRAFQSNYRSPTNGPFKPVPDGFKIDPSRRRLP
jgi:hypothetical protein